MMFYPISLSMSHNTNNIPIVISGFRCAVIGMYLLLYLAYQCLVYTRNPLSALRVLSKILMLRKSVLGNIKITKMVWDRKRYYWDMDFLGFPSVNQKPRTQDEIARVCNNSTAKEYLQTVVWSITSRCSLNCKHCYDWNNFSPNEKLSLSQLKEILFKLEEDGVKHIQLSGGEPLERFDDLVSIIELGAHRIDFWLLTSAFGLTGQRAVALKNAGLVGVNISLDHWEKSKHNEFRGNPESFDWVMRAIEDCRKAGLLVSLSLCTTNEFVSEENLLEYAKMAHVRGVHFIRILEPRRVGRFADEDVLLKKSKIETIESFVTEINCLSKYSAFPIVNFVGFHQRRIGCNGAGDRYLYIDSNGDFHACPFCQGKMGNVFETSIDDARIDLQKRGCHYLPKTVS